MDVGAADQLTALVGEMFTGKSSFDVEAVDEVLVAEVKFTI